MPHQHRRIRSLGFERALEPDELFASSAVCEAQVRLTHAAGPAGPVGLAVQNTAEVALTAELAPEAVLARVLYRIQRRDAVLQSK